MLQRIKENYSGSHLLQIISSFLRQNKVVAISFLILIALTISAFLSTAISGFDPGAQGDLILDRYKAPGFEHFFGTDKFGRDVFSRVLYGGRVSLLIAFSVVLVSSTIGLFYGVIAGYAGGKTDQIMMRILDFLLAFPVIFLLIMIIAIFKTNHWYLIPILGLTSWMETARLIRAEVLSIKERDYILAARGMGLSHFRIIYKHIIPNCISVIFVVAPLKIAEVILLESALSFLGIGIQPPTPSWGNIINDGRETLLSAWWISTFPGLFITLTVLCFHMLADGIKKLFE